MADPEIFDDEEFKPKPIDDILDGNVVDEFNPKPNEKVPGDEGYQEPAEDKPKGEAKPTAAADDKAKGAPPAPDTDDDDLKGKTVIPVKQALDERQKRQTAEKKAKDLEDEIARLKAQPQGQQQQQQTHQPQPPAQPAKRPDPYTDPEGAAAWDQAQADEREFNLRCELTRDTFMEIKGEEDYLEKETAFIEECDRNPALRIALRRAPNPAKFAYAEGAKLLVHRKIGSDPAKYEADLRAEIEAKVRAEIEAEFGGKPAQPDASAKPKARIPTSLAKETSAPVASSEGVWEGPTPIDKLLPG